MDRHNLQRRIMAKGTSRTRTNSARGTCSETQNCPKPPVPLSHGSTAIRHCGCGSLRRVSLHLTLRAQGTASQRSPAPRVDCRAPRVSRELRRDRRHCVWRDDEPSSPRAWDEARTGGDVVRSRSRATKSQSHCQSSHAFEVLQLRRSDDVRT